MSVFEWFESLFEGIQKSGLDIFTNSYLVFQIIIFLLLITIHIVMNIFEYWSLWKVRKGLSKLDSSIPIEELNIHIDSIFKTIPKWTLYSKQWKKYYERIKKVIQIDEKIRVEPFFGYEAMHDTLGRRAILDYGGGLHVSLGVLGTFIGLAIGLAGLAGGDTQQMTEGVFGLIAGMKTAFYTSVAGVVLSLIWIFVDRLITIRTNNEIDWHIDKLHYYLNADDEEIFLNRLEKMQQQQTEQMKTLLTDALEKAMTPFIQTIQDGNQSITDQLRTQSETSQEHLEHIKNQGDEMTTQLIEKVTSATNDTIADFTEMLKVSRDNQESMNQSMQEIVEQFTSVSTRNAGLIDHTNSMVEKFTDLTSHMEHTHNKYDESQMKMQGIMDEVGTMQTMMVKQNASQQELSENNREFMEKSDQLVEQFVQFGERMHEVQTTLIEELVEKTEMVSNRFETLASELRNSSELQREASEESSKFIERAKVAISELIPLSSSLTETVNGLGELAGSLIEMKNVQSELIPQLENWNGNLANRMGDFMTITGKNLEETTKQIRYSKEQWDSTSQQFTAVKNELSSSVREFKDNIESGVQATFQQFDQELKEAVQHFKTLSEHYRETIEYLAEHLESIDKRVEERV